MMFDFESSNIDENSVVFKVPPGLDKQALLEWYNESLNFPYFGYNWDSLNDLLNDLNWISERHVWVCHAELPRLAKTDMVTYINILFDAIVSWGSNQEHVLHFSFPLSAKPRLIEITA